MKKYTVKVRNGKETTTVIDGIIQQKYGAVSLSQVEQILAQAQAEMNKEYGWYEYSIIGDKENGYKIIATDERKQKWVDSKGKTPRLALANLQAFRRITE